MPSEKRRTPKMRLAAKLAGHWLAHESDRFQKLADELVVGGRDAEFGEALRIAAASSQEEADGMATAISTVAEMDFRDGDGGFIAVDLFVVALLTEPGARPSVRAIAKGLELSGLFEEAEIRIAPGWCTVADLSALPPSKVRSLLVDVSEEREPSAISLTVEPPQGEFGVLLCVAMTPTAEDSVLSILQDDTDEMDDDCTKWAVGLLRSGMGVTLALRPCTPSMLPFEVESHGSAAPDGWEPMDEVAADDGETEHGDCGTLAMTGTRYLH
jgi:hypothetical protein